ncbi:MAG TPA: zf-HC2 domain-containing protein [Candidatus Eisenbacteria bacterium]|nr:zf-HC2 domain-containing protein [Candidatus Eisenbacteria bacterium]
MNCYEAIDLMGDELDKQLAPELRAGFDEHLVECAACATYFDQLRATVESLQRIPRHPAAPQRRAELIAAFRREWKRPSRPSE